MTRQVTDQMGRTLSVPISPQRIVSLVPSQTELLHYLGLGERVVGITKFCVHPKQWLKEKTIVGGTKKFRFDVIKSLKPDLIIGNKEENYQEGIESLAEDYPVWMSDIVNLPDALDMIGQVSAVCHKEAEGKLLIDQISKAFVDLKEQEMGSVLYLIWKKPYMAAGADTFIHEMLQQGGFQNCLTADRYPEVSIEQLKQLNPEHIFLSSEPFPFNTAHIEELQAICPEAKVQLVDGEMFSWYGSRLLTLPAYLRSLKHRND